MELSPILPLPWFIIGGHFEGRPEMEVRIEDEFRQVREIIEESLVGETVCTLAHVLVQRELEFRLV